MTTSTATPRAESYLYSRLKDAVAPLTIWRNYAPVKLSTGAYVGKHVRYSWQGSSDVVYIAGVRLVRTVFLVYVAQATASLPANTTLWASALQADADKINDALDQGPPQTISGRVIDGSRRDNEHYFEVWQNNVLEEVQLGAYYVIWSSVA